MGRNREQSHEHPCGDRVPSISIVLISTNEPRLLCQCLGALLRQLDADCELIICRRISPGPFPCIDVPHAAWCFSAPTTTVPELRALGLSIVTADRVAVLEDNAVPASNWLSRIRKTDPDAITGGAINCAPVATICQRAAFLLEY